jgi:hypothetical protein
MIYEDKITVLAVLAGTACALFVWNCRCRRKTLNGMDVTMFVLSWLGATASIWMFIEAALNVGNPPPTWRAYVVALSLGVTYQCFGKIHDMWPKREPCEQVEQNTRGRDGAESRTGS